MTVSDAPTMRDDLGDEVPALDREARLVSLVPSVSETLWWWHRADRLVGVTDYCVAPPSAFQQARRIRGTKNPDVAGIVELAPDLVIADQEENRASDVAALRAAGIAVYVTRVRSVTDAMRSLEGLAAVLGSPAVGIGAARSIRRAIDRVRAVPGTVGAICPIWRDGAHRGEDETWWLVGPDTFAGDLLLHAGIAVRTAPDEQVRPDDRYPRVRVDEPWPHAGVALLPDEPYAFGTSDAAELRAAGWRVRRLDGASLTWWGPRTPSALTDLAEMAAQLRRPRRQSP